MTVYGKAFHGAQGCDFSRNTGRIGKQKLAGLVLAEAERNKAFKKLVSAALAARKGPEAVAKIIDRRLGALEKARGFIDWDKARAFSEDLAATVAVATGELAQASAAMAVDRLLRFIATHNTVFERVEDSSGRIQGIYEDAINALGDPVSGLSAADARHLPGMIMAALAKSNYGYLVLTARSVVAHLPEEVLAEWDAMLADLEKEQATRGGKSLDTLSGQWQYREIRQLIADGLGDLDGLIALEERKHPRLQDSFGVAERLLQAGRGREALDWIRKKTGWRYHCRWKNGRVSDVDAAHQS